MQTLEAIISFTAFMAFASYILLQIDNDRGIDDSLYRYQLANDVWRVLYLRGDFKDLSSISGTSKIDKDIEKIEKKTGFCIYLRGVWATAPLNRGKVCRAKNEPFAAVRHVLLIDGNPYLSTLSIYEQEK